MTCHTSRKARASIGATALAAGALLLVSGPALADVLVLQSTAPGLAAGKEMRDGERIVIPSGKSAVVMLPSGATRTIAGPYDKLVGDLTKGVARNDELVDSVRRMIVSPGRDSVVGATRSVKPAAPVAPAAPIAFSWTDVPISAQGDYCVARNGAISIVRPTASAVAMVTVVDVHSGAKAEVRFPEGAGAAPWPAQMTVKAGTFAFLAQGQPMRQFRLRTIAPLPDRDETLRVLHGQRCEAQMQAFLRTGLVASR